MNLNTSFEALNANRWSFATTTVDERKAKLKKLKQAILNNREEIKKALYDDFKKPDAEAELSEIHTCLDEINYAVNHLKSWMKPKRVSTNIALFGASSKIYYEARGVSLVMAPWNYPFYLVISPLVSSIAAGCVTMLRPSEKAPHTSLIIKKICDEVFSTNEVVVALGDVEVSKNILDLPFEHIFFTGSTRVGKIVMEKASKNLASVTLELGGKSPVIIDREVNLEDAVSKITWGKFLNAGQTCVAPDYIYVPNELKGKLLELIKIQIEKFYGETINDRKNSADFARIIDAANFDRLIKAQGSDKPLLEDLPSKEDHLFIPPTVLPNVTLQSEIMKEEIFGPILPVLGYEKIEEVISHVRNNGKPLALYIFSNKNKFVKKILAETTSGGAVVNHVVLHLANPNLPFGGVGASGLGGSHGYFGFKSFSHERAVLNQGPFTLTNLYFPPYNTWFSKLCFKLLRYLE